MAFLRFCASERASATLEGPIKEAIDITFDACEDFKANADDASAQYVAKHHKLSLADAREWLGGVAWACNRALEPTALESTIRWLKKTGAVPADCEPEPARFVAPGLCEVRPAQQPMPEDRYSWRPKALRKWVAAHRAEHGGASPEMEDMVSAEVLYTTSLGMYHYLATKACDETAELLRLGRGYRVLDVGSGVGGPARYLSWKTGCSVHGVDLQEDLCAVAAEVTAMVGLAHRVTFAAGDVASLEATEAYDAFVSLLVFMHLPEAPRLRAFHALQKALKPDGRFVIEDLICTSPVGTFSPEEADLLHKVVGTSFVPTQARYRAALEATGFVDLEFEDLSPAWAGTMCERIVRKKQSREKLAELLGAEVLEQQVGFYATMVKLFTGGSLGGMRVTGRRPSPGEAWLREGRYRLSLLKAARTPRSRDR